MFFHYEQIVPVMNPEEMNPILACQDRCIRVLSGMNIMLQVCVGERLY